jgi:hypothetical protein
VEEPEAVIVFVSGGCARAATVGEEGRWRPVAQCSGDVVLAAVTAVETLVVLPATGSAAHVIGLGHRTVRGWQK